MRPWVSTLKRHDTLKLAGIVLWLVFTVTFAIWWFKFSIDHISQLAELQPDKLDHWDRQKRMVLWEGTTWIVLLALGGGALIRLVQQERLRVRRIKEFFASFSHEVKTSLASLRLQAEALQDELGRQTSPILGRLVGDTVRLQLQLENSLFLASQDSLQLFVQDLDLGVLVERMREQWPDLRIELSRNCSLRGDERALRTVLSNFVQNARVHGQAGRVTLATSESGGKVRVEISDDGKGFDGDPGSLGGLFHRPKATSGSGIGLHICRMLVTKMGGDLVLSSGPEGFRAVFQLPGALK